MSKVFNVSKIMWKAQINTFRKSYGIFGCLVELKA